MNTKTLKTSVLQQKYFIKTFLPSVVLWIGYRISFVWLSINILSTDAFVCFCWTHALLVFAYLYFQFIENTFIWTVLKAITKL